MSDLYVEIRGRSQEARPEVPDLVLLHGWGLNLRVWDRLADELSDRFRVITVDLPGHGRSEWTAGAQTPAAQAWMLHGTLASITNHYALLGWSLGGQIALDLAAAMPARVAHLVLVATTPRFASAPDWPYGMSPAVIARQAEQLQVDYRRTVSDFLGLQVRGSTNAAAVLAELRNALFQHGEAQPEALATGLEILRKSDLRPALAQIRAPALVIAGQYDRVTPPWASRVLAESLPEARFVEFHRAAHAPFLSHPTEFAELVSGFLGRPRSPAATEASQASSKSSTEGVDPVSPGESSGEVGAHVSPATS